MRLSPGAVAWLAALAAPVAAWAEGPEQLDQVEPGRGEWQAEYSGLVGSGGVGAHALEAMTGVGDRLALGFEVEAETEGGEVAVESFGPKILYRFTREEAPVALALQLQAGFGPDGSLREAEARLIGEAQDEHWWAQGNAMLRRSSAQGHTSASLAYGWSLQRAIAGSVWLGAEGSGQSAALYRDAGAPGEHGHFIGPSLTIELELAPGREIEIGLAAMRKIAGDGPRQSVRLFLQLGL